MQFWCIFWTYNEICGEKKSHRIPKRVVLTLRKCGGCPCVRPDVSSQGVCPGSRASRHFSSNHGCIDNAKRGRKDIRGRKGKHNSLVFDVDRSTGVHESQMSTNHGSRHLSLKLWQVGLPSGQHGPSGKITVKKHHGKNHRTLVVILHLDHVGAPKGQRLENFPMPSFTTIITIMIVPSFLLRTSLESACNIRSIDTWTVSGIQPGMSHDTPGKGRIFFPQNDTKNNQDGSSHK